MNGNVAAKPPQSPDTASRVREVPFHCVPQAITFAPSAASLNANARPMPDVPPVTTTMRPRRSSPLGRHAVINRARARLPFASSSAQAKVTWG